MEKRILHKLLLRGLSFTFCRARRPRRAGPDGSDPGAPYSFVHDGTPERSVRV